jgi:inorganic triphosphatase YgiF
MNNDIVDFGSSKTDDLEVEVALILYSETPQEIANQIASLSSLGDYWLAPIETQDIHDRYLDTNNRSLRDRKIALRIREINRNILLALKGPSRVVSNSRHMERYEIECEWSKDSLIKILLELSNREIRLEEPSLDNLNNPINIMKSINLEVIQDRETHRVVRNVHLPGNVCSEVAELAIDRGVYHFRDCDIRYYEIEIEAKDDCGSAAMKSLVDELQIMFGSEILIWRHSKLAMGMAIENLLKEGLITKHINRNGYLKPEAYDIIRSYLEAI